MTAAKANSLISMPIIFATTAVLPHIPDRGKLLRGDEEKDARQAIHNENSKPWNSSHKLRHDPKEGVNDTTSACEDSEAVLDRTNGWIGAGFGVFCEVVVCGD
ncbi:hypothetical protein KC355_g36 [Hortaea werneckii]|nr:hypothetical protein KC355_g36 [Hortaea werneckii]